MGDRLRASTLHWCNQPTKSTQHHLEAAKSSNRNLQSHLVKATELTAGLPESKASLSVVGWLIVTNELTACTPG